MIIIFGLRRLRKGLGPVMLRCANCGASPLVLFRVSTWFALFFVPLIPFSFKHYTACPNCRRIEDVSKEQVERARAQEASVRASAAPGGDGALAQPVPAAVPSPAPTLETAVNEWATGSQPATASGDPASAPLTVSLDYPQPVTPAGWFPDPSGAAALRYWNGERWTEHTTPAPG